MLKSRMRWTSLIAASLLALTSLGCSDDGASDTQSDTETDETTSEPASTETGDGDGDMGGDPTRLSRARERFTGTAHSPPQVLC